MISISDYRHQKEWLYGKYIKQEQSRTDKIKKTILLSDGTSLNIHLYYPTDRERAATSPIICMFHGGGMVLGYPEQEGQYSRYLAEKTGSLVINFDYPLAPEYQFPKPILLTYEALEKLSLNFSKYGVKNSELILVGHSAGGGLVASLLEINEQKQSLNIIKANINYGVFDWRPFSPQNSKEWSRMDDYFNWYFGKDIHAADTPLASPVLAEYSNLPEMLVTGAQLDPLCKQARQFAKKSPSIIYREYSNVGHGFTHFWFDEYDAEKAKKAWDELVDFIRK